MQIRHNGSHGPLNTGRYTGGNSRRATGWWPAVLRLCGYLQILLSLFMTFAGSAAAAVTITNQAKVTYSFAGQNAEVLSNLTQISVVQTPATLTLYRYAGTTSPSEQIYVPSITYCSGSSTGPYKALPAPVVSGSALALNTLLPLAAANQMYVSEPVFVVVNNPAQNLNSTTVETIQVEVTSATGDIELLKLVETGPDTGQFAGYLQTTLQTPLQTYDGKLAVTETGSIIAHYQNLFVTIQSIASPPLVDPVWRVFDSSTGQPVDGAVVTLLNAAGNPAAVIGDDGVSVYPSTVTSGGTVQDASGKTYTFPAGGYRFPIISPGTYRLRVVPPAGYRGPSTVSDSTLQNLAGAPYYLSTASRGETFTINSGQTIQVDFPLDPVSGGLWVEKSTGKTLAAVGDFVPFTVRVTNTDTVNNSVGTVVADVLPAGLRYLKGSLRIGGAPATEPSLAADGSRITISLGILAPGATREITYVTQVIPLARPGTIVNQVYAIGNGVPSNWATAEVKITEELFRSRSFLAGRVTAGACGSDGEGVGGIRIYQEDGSYVVTDKQGRFHFQDVRPGTHVVQLDIDSLPPDYVVVPCEENSRFAGRSYSQFVDIKGGTLWRVDFHLDKKTPGSGKTVQQKQEPPVAPKPAAPVVVEPPMVTEELVTLSEMVLRPHFPSFSADLTVEDQKMLDELGSMLKVLEVTHFEVVGHTDNVPIAPRSRSIFQDNQELSFARAKAVGRYLLDRLHFPPDKLDLRGMGEEVPLETNRTEEGRALNRRVELKVVTQRRTKVTRPATAGKNDTADAAGTVPVAAGVVTVPDNVVPAVDPTTPVATAAAPVPPVAVAEPVTANAGTPEAVKVEEEDKLPALDQAWMDTVEPGRDWVWPPPVYFPAIPSTHLALKYLPGDTIEITVNGEKVSPLLLDKLLKHTNGSVALSFWRGVPLVEGDNRIVATVIDTAGQRTVLERMLHVSFQPVKGELVPELSSLVADGKTPPVVAIRLFDKDGAPIRSGTTGQFSVAAPFAPYQSLDKPAENNPLIKTEVKYIVGKEGVALLKLQPTTTTGEAVVVIPMNGKDQEFRTWLTPQLRDWILVGLAEGTAGYNAVAGHMENVKSSGVDDKYYENGRLAFFAKGTVQGKWLLTTSFDSAKHSNGNGNGLFQAIDPTAYYTLYGDGTLQNNDAPSSRKLYLKIEREKFYALFGDFTTGMTVTELSRYSRTLNGLKTEYQGEKVEATAFASDTSQAFVRDELRGDGTSGLYHLTRRSIVLNSEKITIETRDRFRSEVIVATKSLTRYLDYTIDYTTGSLFFKQPVASKDENFNPVYIIVEYESNDSKDQYYNYGGRAGVKLLDQRLRAGVSFVHEGQQGGKGNLYGLDTTFKLTENTQVKAEAAATESEAARNSRDGLAYLAELSHVSKTLDAKVYFREQEPGFGLGQQAGSESGTRKIGLETLYRVTDTVTLAGQGYRQYNLLTGADRDFLEAQAKYAEKTYSLQAGVRQATDNMGDGSTNSSTMINTGGSLSLLGNRLTLRATHDQAVFGKNANPDFPTRTTLGADYRLTPKITLMAAQEFTYGSAENSQSTLVGVKSTPWKGGQINSSVGQQVAENGDRVFANLGLAQSWQITDKWSVDGGVDRSQTIKHSGNQSFNVNVPPASGGNVEFTSVTMGGTYKEEKWSWANRLEYRTATTEQKWGGFSGVVGEIREGIATSARLQFFKTNGVAAADDKTNADLRLGLAYRPLASEWIVLDRIDLVYDRDQSSGQNLNSRRFVNNLNLNWKANRQTQVALQYGAKYVQESSVSTDYSGYTDLIGLEARYDLTKTWDVGVNGSVMHSWCFKQFDYSTGASIGYNVAKNVWVSLGYNIIGFEDKDFSVANFTAQGPFVKFRLKFDQESVREAVQWLDQH